MRILIRSFFLGIFLFIISLSSCMKNISKPVRIKTNIQKFKIGIKYNYIVKDNILTVLQTKDFAKVDEKRFDTNINSFVIDQTDDVILGLNNGQILSYNPKNKDTKQIDKFFESIKLIKLSFDKKYLEIVSINNAVLLINRSDLSMSMGTYKENIKDINFDYNEQRLYIEFEDRIEILDVKTKHILKKIFL